MTTEQNHEAGQEGKSHEGMSHEEMSHEGIVSEGIVSEGIVARFMLTAAAFIVIIAGLKAAESVLVPFLLSVFIAVICAPPLAWLTQRKVPGGIAVLIVVVGILGAGILVAGLVGTSLHGFSEQVPEYQQRLQLIVANFATRLSGYGIDVPDEIWKTTFDPGIAMKLAAQTLASLGNVMTNGFLILLTVVFILAEMSVFKDKLLAISGEQDTTEATLDRFITNINQYMALKTLISLLTGGIVYLWLLFFGLDYALLWAVLAFFLNFVPTLGSILAAIPAVLLALVQLGVGDAVIIALGYVAVNTIVGNILEPRFMGKGLNLSALVVFLSLVFWGWVLGPVGMLLSVPLTMGVKVGLELREETHWIGVLLGSDVPERKAAPNV